MNEPYTIQIAVPKGMADAHPEYLTHVHALCDALPHLSMEEADGFELSHEYRLRIFIVRIESTELCTADAQLLIAGWMRQIRQEFPALRPPSVRLVTLVPEPVPSSSDG